MCLKLIQCCAKKHGLYYFGRFPLTRQLFKYRVPYSFLFQNLTPFTASKQLLIRNNNNGMKVTLNYNNEGNVKNRESLGWQFENLLIYRFV
jgi:hypothetical protein